MGVAEARGRCAASRSPWAAACRWRRPRRGASCGRTGRCRRPPTGRATSPRAPRATASPGWSPRRQGTGALDRASRSRSPAGDRRSPVGARRAWGMPMEPGDHCPSEACRSSCRRSCGPTRTRTTTGCAPRRRSSRSPSGTSTCSPAGRTASGSCRDPDHELRPRPPPDAARLPDFGRTWSGPRTMLMMDPPDHTRLRKLVSKAFTPRTVEQLRPHVADLVAGMLDDADPSGFDLIADRRLPAAGHGDLRAARRSPPRTATCSGRGAPTPPACSTATSTRPPSSAGCSRSCRWSTTSTASSRSAAPTRATTCSPRCWRPRRRATSSPRRSCAPPSCCCSSPATRPPRT